MKFKELTAAVRPDTECAHLGSLAILPSDRGSCDMSAGPYVVEVRGWCPNCGSLQVSFFDPNKQVDRAEWIEAEGLE